ncbi:MAG: DUF2341 domain-containing protein [Chitinispirillaceae bacterium]|jgi:hypothetical protein
MRTIRCFGNANRLSFVFPAALAAFLFSATTVSADYSAWQHSVKLYLNTTSTGANVMSNKSDFPMLVRLNNANFGNAFSQCLSNGADIRFEQNGTVLSYETEKWDSSGQNAVIWVRVPTVYGNNNSQYITMHWGKSGVSSESNSAAVFTSSSNYAAVYHLKESSGSFSDATSNGYTGTRNGSMSAISAVIDNGQTLNGTTDYASMGNVLNPGTSNMTISAWVKRGGTSNINTIIAKSNGGTPSSSYGWLFTINADNSVAMFIANGGTNWGDAGSFVIGSATQITDLTTWHYVTAVINKSSSSSCKIYIDGVDQTGTPNGNVTTVGSLSNSVDFRIGAQADGNCKFKGGLDEVIVSTTAHTAEWIKLCYENQKTNQTLINFQPVASNVNITGTVQVGSTLTGHYSYSDAEGDAESGTTFKWYRADDTNGTNKAAISGATSSTYTLVSADANKRIQFEVTPGAATGATPGEPALSAYTVAVQAVPVASNVSISGTGKVGDTLTGNYTYSDVNGDTESGTTYKWYRADNGSGSNKTLIAGATQRTYIPVLANGNKYICFEVTPGAATGATPGVAVTSAYIGPIQAPPVASNVTITGTAQVGSTLTGSYTYSDANGDAESGSTFKWYRADDASGTNRTQISGATASTYTLVTADANKRIQFEVTPGAATGATPGLPVSSSYSAAIQVPPAASNVTITGTIQIGQLLTGHYTYSDANGDAEGGTTFKWYRADDTNGTNKTAISGATASTYTLVSADANKYIQFEVTPGAATGQTPGTAVSSSFTVPVQAPPIASNVTITGTAQVGSVLTGNYTYSDINGDQESGSIYKWYRADNSSGTNRTLISGATSVTYTLALADGNKYIQFEVTPGAATGATPGTAVSSSYTGPVQAPPVASNITITGTDQVGNTLTGHYAYSDVNGDTESGTTFKWYRADDTNGTNKTAISSATALTYTLVSADANKNIKFEVTPGAATGMTPGVPATSAYTVAVQVPPVASNVTITGTVQVGLVVTGHYTYSDLNGDVEGGTTFKWYRADDNTGTNKASISGATGITYTPVATDVNKYLQFEVTPGAATGQTPGLPVTSTFTGTVQVPPVASAVSITGTLKGGRVLTGQYTYSDANNDQEGGTTFQWYRADDNTGTNKIAISGATSITYTLASADENKYIQFAVTPGATTGATPGTTTTSSFVGPIIPAQTPPVASAVIISGTPKVGQTLTGSYTYYDAEGDAESGSTFQWYRATDSSGTNRTAISGATSITYTMTDADEDKYIQFEVTPHASSGIQVGTAVASVYSTKVISRTGYNYVYSKFGDAGLNVKVDGQLRCNSLLIHNWLFTQNGSAKTQTPPDYVFDKNYNLVSLDQVEKFIKENGHLPEVPSAKELEQNGVDMVQMNFVLLKKIEEITLHMISMQKELDELKGKK